MRTIADIARDIEANWSNVSVHARPYLDAMKSLQTMTDKYGPDCVDADGIILYFLHNAQVWHGEAARRIKSELRTLLG